MSHFRDRFRELFRIKQVLLGGVFALGVVSGALALSLVRARPPEMESTGGRPLPGKKAGLRDTITVIEGDALKTLPGLKGPFDFVFIDAWKEDYIRYFRTVFPRVTRGGLIIGHNAVEHASTMKDYLDAVTRHPDLETVIISTAGEDGIAISRKAGGGTGR